MHAAYALFNKDRNDKELLRIDGPLPRDTVLPDCDKNQTIWRQPRRTEMRHKVVSVMTPPLLVAFIFLGISPCGGLFWAV
jgi:hypothetical protein